MKKLLFIFCFLFLTFQVCLAQIIVTVAGNGTAGYSGDGGQATAAEISRADALSFDGAGNYYIADQNNGLIRKVTTSGIITTVAGGGSSGLGDGGQATDAEFSAPNAVIVDAAGNMYIADEYDLRIRKVNTAGIITTIAGGGFSGLGDGGQATAAELSNPVGVVFDAAGNLYIADYSNNRIRKINTSGIIYTVAGGGSSGLGDGGQATNAELNAPSTVVFDATGNMYITDRLNNRVRKVNTAGIITTIAGTGTAAYSGDGGQATAAEINGPWGIVFDATGNLYIADMYNNRIRSVNTAGIITTIAGNGTAGFSGDGGPAIAAELNEPGGLAFYAGTYYIADASNNRIRKITLLTSSTCTALGTPVYFNDFGSNPALYAPALPTGQTQYPYVTGVPPNDSYVISDSANPSNTFGYVDAGDHTGNLNGDMMVVNADYPPDTVYTTTVMGLCPNTTYVFSAYVANNNTTIAASTNCGSGYIYANVKLQVEYPPGTVQGSISTGNLPTAPTLTALVWVQASFVFTTVPGQTTAEITIINNAPGGCGNDYVVDDISLAPCGSSNLVTITGNTVVCSGATTTLTASGVSSYTWSANAGNATTASVVVTPTVTTTYTIEGASTGGCSGGSSMAVATVSVVPNLPVSITGDTLLCIGQTTTLTTSGASSYTWSANAGNANTASVVLTPSVTTIYSVVVEGSSCIGQATATVDVVTHPLVSVIGNTFICAGNTTTLTATGASNYIWNTGATTTSINLSPTTNTTYSVIGSIGSCTAQAVATVNVLNNINVSITGDTTICYGQQAVLTANGATNYIWNTGAITSVITISPTVTTNYVVVGAIGSCTAQAVALVNVNTLSDFSMPNIVTPNNDGVNDYIDFSKYQFSSMQLDIYNRWGLNIFESTNPACIWKPTADDGTYFYTIQYIINCNNETQSKTLKGFITVIR
jgi:gliding motility-associated-like protein